MSSSATDQALLAQQALERAKAIAAKLSGTVPGADTSAGGTKRRRWDEPNGGNLPDDDELKKAKTNVGLAAGSTTGSSGSLHEKRIWISTTDERPAQHYVLHLTDRIKELNDSNGVDLAESDRVTAKLLGRGSDEPVVPGLPQLPLHIFLTAPSHQQVTVVSSEIQQWIEEADAAPALNYGEQSLAVRPPPKDSYGSGSSSTYRPASVAQLIHGSSMVNSDVPFTHHLTFGVPHSVVGYIIGRGGSTLAQLQASTGVSVQIQKESELEPGQTQRQITLSAHDDDSLQTAKRQIERLVREKCGPTVGAPGLGFTKKHLYDAKLEEAIAAGHTHLTIQVPEDDVGLVIGKQGATIRQIQENTGCHVQVMPPDTDEESGKDSDGKGEVKPRTRAVHVTHPSEQGAQAAKAMIEGIIKNRPPSHHAASFSGSNHITVQVAIPDRDVGLCIGKQGSVIRQIQNVTGCRIQIPPQCGPGETHRIVSVTGSHEGTDMVRRIVETISAEQSSTCVMSGDYNQYMMSRQQQGYFYGQPQQSQDPNQQYSAEWAAYHAAQATVQQQQTQQQQVPQLQAHSESAAGTVAPSADAYYEDFFRYSYYYGEDAARQYYGAWSPPAGTPNPYGVNPNIQAPPSGAGVAANSVASSTDVESPTSQTAPTTTAASSARDTSQRRVSNLPAWMTKS